MPPTTSTDPKTQDRRWADYEEDEPLNWMAAEGISGDCIAEAVRQRPSDDEDNEVVLEENVPSYEALASRNQPRARGKIRIEVKVRDDEKWPSEALGFCVENLDLYPETRPSSVYTKWCLCGTEYECMQHAFD